MIILKSVFIIAIVAVAMIGVMVPSVFAADYTANTICTQTSGNPGCTMYGLHIVNAGDTLTINGNLIIKGNIHNSGNIINYGLIGSTGTIINKGNITNEYEFANNGDIDNYGTIINNKIINNT